MQPRPVLNCMLRIRSIHLKMGAMPKPRPNKAFLPPDDRIFPVKQRKAVPYAFVLDALADLPTETRTMFGCLAVYLGDKIVLILRDRRDPPADNGVWLATTEEHHQSLAREFPSYAIHSVIREGNYRLAGSSRRRSQISSKQPCALAN